MAAHIRYLIKVCWNRKVSILREITYAQALRESIAQMMRDNKKTILIGEDVGKGYRGCFGVSTGLYEEFGASQVIDTPIAENTVLGTGIGAALMGFKVIVEIMFADFIGVCFDGVLNQIAKINFMSAGQYRLDLVLRMPGGSGQGTGPHHSQCLESIFMNIPGLKVVLPSNAYEAKGLLNYSLNCPDPVIFLEHKRLYKTSMDVPEEAYSIPFGKARIVREGKDLTLVAVSYMVRLAIEAAQILSREHGIEVEIIDPRTLSPLDSETIIESLKKTNRLVTLEEGIKRGGVGAEISARIADEAIEYLDSPIRRIASKNMVNPMSPLLEEAMLPGIDDIVDEIKSLIDR